MKIKELIKKAHEEMQKRGYKFGRYSVEQGVADKVPEAITLKREKEEKRKMEAPGISNRIWSGPIPKGSTVFNHIKKKI